MVRDDLYITVPTFFRCPISLDVMKSPVSLCTGVTYDRSSIQRWLDTGNNTCPATMQVLHSKEFVPNRTLQRLIQIWSDSAQQRNRVDSDSPPNSVPSKDQINCLVKDIEAMKEANTLCLDALSKIICFAKESEENLDFLAQLDGLVPILVGSLGNVEDEDGSAHKNIDFIEEVVMALDMILSKMGDKEELMALILKNDKLNCLTSLLLVLQQGGVHARIGSARILESIAMDAESKLSIAEKDGLLPVLVKSIGLETDPSLIEASLSCLIAISMAKRVKVQLVHLKTIAELRKLLKASNTSVSITERALKLLETVSSCKEGRAELCRDSGCIEVVVQKALKVSSASTEHAVAILWNVCFLFRDQRAQDAVTRNNGFTKVLLLMQSNCSPAVRQMLADLLKIFRVNSKSCLVSYDTKTTHIMPF